MAQSEQAKHIFSEAVELPPEQRAEFLASRCAGDAALRAEVESLLRAHQQADRFLGGPTVAATAIEPAADDLPLKQVGPYKLLQIIGEGGFGTVYMADQEHPVRRRVALKVIKLGMDTRQVIARFEAERQALAIMDHPNIARVFDAGATETGRPYFVMELVKGDPITRYCDLHRLTPRQRLELFVPVCQAVQHAHQKGIIHRDIKPSNVLVTLHDGKPVPKVIDFGIAKATQARLTEKTLFTEFRQMIGTPEYMSPEQAEMSGLDIDTRSDIYSLGVLLYELLTGTTPFDARELRSKAFAEIQRVIREDEPPRMSIRLSTLKDSLPSIAAQRSTEPKKLGTIVRGELDWIVTKCIEKDRTRRYESAAALAQDIGRHLADEPVVAAAPSAMYRMRKFVRRHRVGVTMTVAIFLALLLGLAAALYGLRRAVRAEALAQDRLEQVSREADKAAAVNTFLNSMLTAADPFRASSVDLSVREMLEQSAARIDAGAMANQPHIEVAVRTTIGRSFHALGRPAEATEQLRRALETLRKTSGGADKSEIGDVLNLLGMCLADDNRLDEAERAAREAMDMRTRLHGPGNPKTLESMSNLASIVYEKGDAPQAEALYRRVALLHETAGAAPQNRATSLNGLAVLLSRSGKLDEAEKVMRQVIELNDRVLERDDPTRAVPLSNLAMLLMRQQRFADAETPLREAMRITSKSLPENHPDRALVAYTMAQLMLRQNRLAEAEDLLRKVIEMQRKAGPRLHPEQGAALASLGDVLLRQQRLEEAESAFKEAYQIHVRASGADHPESADMRSRLGNVQAQMNKLDEADENLRGALAALRARQDVPKSVSAQVAARLANLLQQRGKPDEAEPLFKESIEVLSGQSPPAPMLLNVMLNYSDIPLRRGEFGDAERISREALDLANRLHGTDSTQAMTARGRLALVLARGNTKLEEAEQIARQLLAERQKVLSDDSWQLQHTRSLLGEILWRRGQVEEGRRMIHEACDRILADAAAPDPAKRDARERMAMLDEGHNNLPPTQPAAAGSGRPEKP